MSKTFNPVDYNLAANPALKRTNTPIRFGAVLLSLALVIALLWHFFPPKIRITNRSLETRSGQVFAVAQAVNDTGNPATVTVQFTIGYQFFGAKGDARFLQLGSHDASYTLEPHSTTRVSSEFTYPPGTMPTQADVQIISFK